MYGPTRFFDNNLITASNVTVDSVRGGTITGSIKSGSGSALMYTSGDYTGDNRRTYLCQIDSIAGGAEVGQATFKWRSSDTAVDTWEATGVTTSLTAITLEDGIDVLWVNGTGADFVVNDQFSFWVIPTYGIANTLDYFDRGKVYLSDASDVVINITIDLGSAQTITAVALGDHNLTDSATITVKGNTADSWGAPAYSQSVTLADIATLYLSESYRYWRFTVDDSGTPNPDDYIQVGILYLGDYLQLAQNSDWGSSQNLSGNTLEQTSPYGIAQMNALSWQDLYTLNYTLIDNDDVDDLRAMLKSLFDFETSIAKGLILHLFSDETDEIVVGWIVPELSRAYDFIDLNSFSLSIQESPLVSV